MGDSQMTGQSVWWEQAEKGEKKKSDISVVYWKSVQLDGFQKNKAGVHHLDWMDFRADLEPYGDG